MKKTTPDSATGTAFSTETIPIWAAHVQSGAEPIPYDVLANRPPIAYREGLFRKVCTILGLDKGQEHLVRLANLPAITNVQEMTALIPPKPREHFLKVYAGMFWSQGGWAA